MKKTVRKVAMLLCATTLSLSTVAGVLQMGKTDVNAETSPVFSDGFDYTAFQPTSLYDEAAWQVEVGSVCGSKSSYTFSAPAVEDGVLKFVERQSIQFSWTELDGFVFDASKTYTLKFDVKITDFGDDATTKVESNRELYFAPGGYYNQIELNSSATENKCIRTGGNYTGNNGAEYTTNTTYSVEVVWEPSVSKITSTLKNGDTVISTGSRNESNRYTNAALNATDCRDNANIMCYWVMRCEDGAFEMDNFSYSDGTNTYEQNFDFESSSENTMVNNGYWTKESDKFQGTAPTVENGVVKFEARNSIAFNWTKLAEFNSENSYVFEFDAMLTSESSNSARAIYVAFGGWYNQIELQCSGKGVRAGDTWVEYASADYLNKNIHIEIVHERTTITSTLYDESGNVIVSGTRTNAEYADSTNNSMQSLVLRCEGGGFEIDNFEFRVEDPVEPNMGELYTQEAFCGGASIRLVEDGKSGIRFHVRVPAESYLGDNINTLQTGMLVIPTDKLGGVELTHANTRDNYTPLGAKAADESTTGKWRETVDGGVSYMESLVYVYNIPEDSYDRGFTFRGYIKYDETYYYTAIPESRSITYVAMKANHEYNTQGSSGEITYSPSQLTVLEQYSPSRTAISSNLKNVGKYYYRVGNENVVPLDKLFALTDEYLDIAPINLSVKFETLQGTATGSYADGNFQFSNTGFVRISVLDTYSRKSSILIVEVVNGVNVTSSSITGSTGQNVVLLNDVKIATGGYVVYNNCTVYGNGFTFSVEGGVSKYSSGTCDWGIITLKSNAKLDNLVVIGDTYTGFGTYTSDSYNVAAVYSKGGTIQNCYIQGCASPVLVEGATTIESTTLYGGAVANLQLKNGATTLNDVTTVNYNDGRKVIGLGVVFRSDAKATTTLTINGAFKQYNFVASTDANNSGASTLQQIYDLIFDNSQCSAYHFTKDGKAYANTGIVSMSENITTPTITDNTSNGYQGKSVSKTVWFTTVKGYVYSQPNTVGTVDNSYSKETDKHISSVQGDQNLSGQSGGVWTPPSIMG